MRLVRQRQACGPSSSGRGPGSGMCRPGAQCCRHLGDSAVFSPIALDATGSARLWPYVQIARIDHWFKNAFMLLGVLLAIFYEPRLFAWSSLLPLSVAVLSTCLVASSNYVLNELLDGPRDRLHPEKRFRPVPSGRIWPPVAYAEWLLL